MSTSTDLYRALAKSKLKGVSASDFKQVGVEFVAKFGEYTILYKVGSSSHTLELQKNGITLDAASLNNSSSVPLTTQMAEMFDQYFDQYLRETLVNSGAYGYKLDAFGLYTDEEGVEWSHMLILIRQSENGEFEGKTFRNSNPEIVRLVKLYLFIMGAEDCATNLAITNFERNPVFLIDDVDNALDALLTTCIQWVILRKKFTVFSA
jgi:hypothetical protein